MRPWSAIRDTRRGTARHRRCARLLERSQPLHAYPPAHAPNRCCAIAASVQHCVMAPAQDREAQSLKHDADAHCRAGRFYDALPLYTHALECAHDVELRSALLSNRCLALLRTAQAAAALEDALQVGSGSSGARAPRAAGLIGSCWHSRPSASRAVHLRAPAHHHPNKCLPRTRRCRRWRCGRAGTAPTCAWRSAGRRWAIRRPPSPTIVGHWSWSPALRRLWARPWQHWSCGTRAASAGCGWPATGRQCMAWRCTRRWACCAVVLVGGGGAAAAAAMC